MHAAGSNKQLRRRRYNIQQEEYARGNSATAPQFWLHPKYNNEKIKHKQKKYNFKSFACTSRSSNIAVLNILKLVVLIRSLKYTLIKKIIKLFYFRPCFSGIFVVECVVVPFGCIFI